MNAPVLSKDVATRMRIRVRGRVQGVGFRPFIWTLAHRHGLSGFVLNDGDGVLIEAEGRAVAAVLDALKADAPPLSRIDGVECHEIPLKRDEGFIVAESAQGVPVRTQIGPDAPVCDACLAEMFAPGGRRYLYPFTTCTHCGPRYTVTARLPYDRPQTSLAPFPLCAPCMSEYVDPADRRFHAETTACAACGPRMTMSPAEIWSRIAQGQIVAVKGLGGFHLVCDAHDAAAVDRLRARKLREAKPFAVMTLNIASARRLAWVSSTEDALLTSRLRPIVVAKAKTDGGLAPGVACGLTSLGLLLPYTPLQYLIVHEALGRPRGLEWLHAANDVALVMTSANAHDEPLAISAGEARESLRGIADAIADHDREILIRADDSVVRVVAGAPAYLRRARGAVPEPIELDFDGPPVLAVGAHQKTTICLTRGREAFVSQHIGDMTTARTRAYLNETIAHLTDILDVRPSLAAHDLHPDFATTTVAQGLNIPTIPVQHHHAHIASVMAEHRLTGPIIGAAMDGYGMGLDGQAWGGELLLCDRAHMRRLGHLAPLPCPGGDRAAREPWRMAAAALHVLGRGEEIAARFPYPQAHAVAKLLAAGVAPQTTSMGRLFDAACGLLGVQQISAFEGQAPMLLEGVATAPACLAGGWRLKGDVIDFLPLLAHVATCGPREGANVTHGTFAAGLSQWILGAARRNGVRHIALSGGCFQNKVLTEATISTLSHAGLSVFVNRAVPANDGGLSLGQAFVAAQFAQRI